MRWDVVQAAFEDELTKIGAFSLSGLSPQSVLERGQPAQPMETPGLTRALAILDRYEAATAMPKTAEVILVNVPQYQKLTGGKKPKKGEKITIVDRGKSIGGHVIGGMSIGRLLGEVAHGPNLAKINPGKMHSGKWWATVAGGAIGAGEFTRKRISESIKRKRELKHKTAAISGTPGFSPAQKLKVEQQTASLAKPTGRFGAAGPQAISRIAKSSLRFR